MGQTLAKPVKAKTPGKFTRFKAAVGVRALSADEEEALRVQKQQEAAEKLKKEQAELAKKKAKVESANFKLKLKQDEAQAHYQRLKKEADEASDALGGLTGAAQQLTLIDAGRAAAAKLAEGGMYTDAVKGLEKLGAPGLRDKGLAADANAAKQVGTLYPDLTKRAQALKTELPRLPISADRQTALTDTVDAAIDRLKSPKMNDGTVDEVKNTLDAVSKEVEQARTDGEAARGRYIAGLAKAQPAVKELQTIAADTEVAPLIREITLAAGLARSKEFGRAADMIERVVSTADTVKKAAEDGRVEWEKSQALLAQLLSDARALAANPIPVLAVRDPKAASIVSRLEGLQGQIEAGDLGRRMAYAAGVKVINETFAQVAELNIVLQNAGGIGQGIQTANTQVDAAVLEVRTALGEMHEAMAETMMGSNVASDGSLGTRLETIVAAWEKTKTVATSEAELGVAKVLGELTKLKADVEAVSENGGAQFKMHRDQLFTVAREKFDRAEAACAGPLATLFDSSIADGMKFQAEIDKAASLVAKAGRPAEIDAQSTIVAAILARINQVAQALSSTMDQVRVQANALLEQARVAIAAFEKTIAETKEKQKHNPLKNDAAVYTPQLEALKSDFSQIEAVLPVSDHGGLTESSVELRALIANTKAAQAAITGGRDEDGKSVVTLSSLTTDLKELRAKLDRKDFRTYLGITQAELIDKAEDLKDKLPSMAIPKAVTALEDLQTKYDDAKKKLEANKKELGDFETMLAEALKIVKEKKASFDTAPDVYEDFKARIRACESASRVEGELAKARTQMFTILHELIDTVSDPSKIAQKQRGAIDAKQKAAEDAAKFDGEYDSFMKTLAGYAEIKKGDRKAIEELARNAKKAFKANGDFNGAMIQLRAASQRAELLHKYPDGQSVATRNNLPAVVAKWKTAASNFSTSLAALESKISGIDDKPEFAVAKTAALKAIGEVKPLLIPTAFDAVVKKMTTKGAAPTAMTAAREEGLRILRRCNAYIDKDYRFMELAGNPFEPGVKADTVALHLALADLENNLLISL